MQTLRSVSRLPLARCSQRITASRCLSTVPLSSDPAISSSSRPVPWFVDREAERAYDLRPSPPHLPSKGVHTEVPPVPEDAPNAVKFLHAALVTSPHLEPTELLVTVPPEIPAGPPLPEQAIKGKRRRRGARYSGEGVQLPWGGLWKWYVLAVVKEGTERRGAVESVVRLVRRSLCKMQPPLHLPPQNRRKVNDTWAMVDGGNFAVHILSKSAKEKYFTRMDEW
ncbi:hypothetical protein NEOLEDRAFT_1242818 [Neolentinus lepideus HHB14362 ss-1]|uniref:Uncharacterized protein n=1 Tax=Neolentinus lepideus HHB14362 ss-1 TaxID=1314782 RepID=A0A165RQ21_9AGAM|nr:hypothetical protein NEOLEDRAFT_1242818 [Neolentinus lepideus HHB14362 ss-1]